MTEQVGRDARPTHYDNGRETIDKIRDELGDEGFIAFCLGNALKYEDRAGKKDALDIEMGKAKWYRQMAQHVRDGSVPDPRSERPGFEPYVRSDAEGHSIGEHIARDLKRAVAQAAEYWPHVDPSMPLVVQAHQACDFIVNMDRVAKEQGWT